MPTLARLLLACLSLLTVHSQAASPRWEILGIDSPTPISVATAGGIDGVVLVARGEAAPLRSTDGGRTWAAFDVLGQNPIAFLGSPADANVFYALVGSMGLAVNPPPRALYRSNDGGATWQLVTPRIQTPAGQVIDYLSPGATPELIYGSRMQATNCFTGSCSFDGAEGWMSTDGGRSWRLSDPDSRHYSHRTFASPSDAKVAYATTLAGLYRTADGGGSWQLVLPSSTVYERQVVVDGVDPQTVYVRFDNSTQLRVTQDGGATWRTSDAVNVPGPTYRLVVDPVQAGRLYFIGYEGQVFESRDRARTWHRVVPSSGGPVQMFGTPLAAHGTGDTRVFYSTGYAGVKRAQIDDASLFLGVDIWWNPSQSGWGLSLTQHASGQLFGVWFTYDSQGAAVWRVMPGGTWSGRRYSATIYETRGPAYFGAPFDAAKVVVSRVGEATLDFSDDSHATFAWRLDDGVTGSAAIARQLFGPPGDGQFFSFPDLWWNPSESGWGVAVAQQFANVFAVWFVYDGEGHPTWLVMPEARYAYTLDTYLPIYRGNVYSARGPAAGTVFDPSKVVLTAVGNGSVTFGPRDSGVSQLDVFGSSVRRSVSRQPF